jgi:hypothetical protein
MNYSRITSEAGMVMKRHLVMISISGRVPGRASKFPPELGSTMATATEVSWMEAQVFRVFPRM